MGPKGDPHVAVPITKAGKFIDLLLIDIDSLSFTTACATDWLGCDEFAAGKIVRLQRHPVDWLAAGCRGVCHIEPISRQALKELSVFEKIHCDDIHTALEAWDWGFSGNEDELGRFVIDAEPDEIRDYFDNLARWQAIGMIQRTELWPRSKWRSLR